MSFEERLAYLETQIPDAPPPEVEEEDSLFGIDAAIPDTQWWTLGFWQLCFEDLRTIQWPTPQQVLQTLVASQVRTISPHSPPRFTRFTR